MKTRCLLCLSAIAGMTLPSTSQAALLVEQWMGGGNGFLAAADAKIASGPANYSGTYNVIDFTDDPAGFAGDIAGSNFWPSAGGVNLGTGHSLNNNFVARVTTMLTIGSSDWFWFKTWNDDGVRVRVGGTNVIVDNSYHAEQLFLGSIFLSAGTYPVEVVFFENGGEASLEFTMARGTATGPTTPFGHVGNFAGTSTGTNVPEGGASIALLGLALSAIGVLRKKVSA